MKMNKKYFVLGIFLIFLSIFGINTFASSIDSVDVQFSKEVYSVNDNGSLRITYTLANNSLDTLSLLVTTNCEEELECDYSKSLQMLPNSSTTQSFVVQAIDEGSPELTLIVKDKITHDTKEFTTEINVDDQLDDGDFAISLNKTSFCSNYPGVGYIKIENNYEDGLYNIKLTSTTLPVSLNQNDVYLEEDEEKIVSFNIPLSNLSDTMHELKLSISNDDLLVTKVFNISLKECIEDIIAFTVIPNTTSTYYRIAKGETVSLTYTIKNIGNIEKTFYISEDGNGLSTDVSEREVYLAPGQSKQVSVYVTAPKNINSGLYTLDLNFFDEKDFINYKIKFDVIPIHSLESSISTKQIVLAYGKITPIYMVLENKGDLSETFTITTKPTNDLQITTSSSSITLTPHSRNIMTFNVSCGTNTEKIKSPISIIVQGNSSGYYNKHTVDVIVTGDSDSLSLTYLSFPSLIEIDKNSSKEISFEVYNFGEEDIVIDSINLRRIPQQITYRFSDVTIPAGSSGVVTGTIFTGDIEPQEISAEIVLSDKDGYTATRPIKINVLQAIPQPGETEEVPQLSRFAGFFTLGNSILVGIIALCLVLIILYATGAIKQKRTITIKSVKQELKPIKKK